MDTTDRQQMLREILQEYFETYNDEKAFPREEYPELWKHLEFIEDFLKE